MTEATQALIEAAEAYLKNPMGDVHRYIALQNAISSAKAAEEGVETMWRVDSLLCGTYSPCTGEVKSREIAEDFMLPNDRLVRLDTYTTVIEVREKEGLHGG